MPEKIVDLSPSLRGNVITPATSEYDVARKVYNGMIDRHPDAIVRCANVADVRTVVNFAQGRRVSQLRCVVAGTTVPDSRCVIMEL